MSADPANARARGAAFQHILPSHPGKRAKRGGDECVGRDAGAESAVEPCRCGWEYGVALCELEWPLASLEDAAGGGE